ncbi:MAG: multicopper oxidase domain-containing protein [Myxococcota bacterium]|nr:multicopper oxidase domain-containing protein [Myxococcota bacterium]
MAQLNALLATEGPYPGQVADPLPSAEAAEALSEAARQLSDGQTHSPDVEHLSHHSFETEALNTDHTVAHVNLHTDHLQDNGKVDVPTGAPPSFLYGAEPFTQSMLRFEEFGRPAMGPESLSSPGMPLPKPISAQGYPDGTELDAFLTQHTTKTTAYPSPYPTEWANDPDYKGTHENPWRDEIEAFLGRRLVTPPAEGRPPGEEWSHQRWTEFFPEVYIDTAQTGARTNTGLRDPHQMHGYESGEFGSGPDGISGTADDGLYHAVHAAEGEESTLLGSNRGLPVRFHPNMPVQQPDSLWTFDGTLPPKLLMARYGEPILLRHYNTLPIDPSANMGFGAHTISTHEHNGHNPAESDGYTQSFFFPGQFYDYHWPMVLAGHDSINTDASDPRAAAPDGNGGTYQIRGDWRETMSTHWFHDHMLDFTAQNVYKGNAAMMNYYSALDRGNEALDDGINLRLPSGSTLDWGNRDYDINLFIKGIAWDPNGQLWFNIFNTDGMLGDRMVTNWLWNPYLDVRARRYRFRILNASVARYFKLALVEQVAGSGGELAGPRGSGISYNRVPFYMVANDGNILEHAVYFDGNKAVGGLRNRKGILPTQAIAERYDIVVDFAQFEPGTRLYFVNLLEHRNGRRPHTEIPLQDVLDGTYAPRVKGGRNRTDTTVTRFLEFRVQPCTKSDGSPAESCASGGDAIHAQQDRSMDPADFIEGKQKMIELPGFTEEELANAVHRTFEFGRSSGTDSAPWTIKTDGGAGYNMDPRRVSAAAKAGQTEIWHLKTSGGWSHPIHIHFEEGQILRRDGKAPPEWEKWSRKDTYRIGRMADSGATVDVAIRFREFLGSYMEHCHNTQHEDHAMLLRWDNEAPGQVRVMPAPMPTWDGVGYVPAYALPTFRSGDLSAKRTWDAATANPAGVPVAAAPEAPAPETPPTPANAPAPETPPAPANAPAPEVPPTPVRPVAPQAPEASIRRIAPQAPQAPVRPVAPQAPEASVGPVAPQAPQAPESAAAPSEPAPQAPESTPGPPEPAEAAPQAPSVTAPILEPAEPAPAHPVFRVSEADKRGRIRVRGTVLAGEEVLSDAPRVRCRTSSRGRYRCSGRGLVPGQVVEFFLQ